MYNKAKTIDEKLFILQEYISLINSTLFTQTMYSEFEDYAHKLAEKQMPITKDILLEKYRKLQNKYNGDVVEKMDEQKYAFMIVPHFYRAYYVYSYATGITCAVNFAKKCIESADGVDKLRKFLASGQSDYPLNILKSCGIDLETNEPYDVVMAELEWALQEVEKLIGE